jgi:predicted transglutaminase-like protease
MPPKDAHKLAKNEEYYKYIKNLSKNEIAKAVKIEDLKHNADIRRPPQKIDDDYYSKRIAKYTAALKMLNGGIVGHT